MFLTAVLLAAILVAACGMSAPIDNLEATLHTEAELIVAEATAIRATAEVQTTHAAGTMAASDSYVQQRRAINTSLLATARANVQPTQQVVANVFGGTPDAILRGERWFVKTGTSSRVQASNGCVVAPQGQFTTDAEEIYATFEAHNIAAGTPLSASWLHDGQVVHQESFNLNGNYGLICLWFSISPSVVPFTPGVWSVQLYAEGFPLEGPMSFTIR